MSRPCVAPAAVGAELLATVAVAVTVCRHHLTDPDPKTALRAVAELTKLLGVCARHGLAVDAAVVPPPAPEPGRTRERRNDGVPSLPRPAPTSPPTMPLPDGRGPQDPSLPRPAPNLPPGGRTLTSFLGSPAAKKEAG